MTRRLWAAVAVLALSACRETPHAQYRRGAVRPAAEAYAHAVEGGDTSAVARYNLGTALLRLRAFDEARPHLEAATAAHPLPAQYNLGNTHLEPAFADTGRSEARRTRLQQAIARYKRALLAAPADRDAKWNLELAQRLLTEAEQSGGGGGGAGEDEGGGDGDDTPTPQPAPGPPTTERSSAGTGNPDLSRGEAERLLSAAERDERQLQRRKLRQGQPSERPARDW